MRKVFTMALLAMVLGLVLFTGPAEASRKKGPKVQLAILLDTSSSMSGLIEQAKTQLWSIVNEFTRARSAGEKPSFQVALYEYGNNGLSKESGYVRQILPFTDDLDRVYEELFSLTTNGGEEYCGTVIRDSVEDLEWSGSKNDYRVIFIAGNEPFNQGSVDYRESCKSAIGKGIIVNTIHCGDAQTGVDGKWKDGATLAEGAYLHIDHNRKVVHISAPQDDEINRLGAELNKTYVPYGSSGGAGLARQSAQDSNAGSLSSETLAKRNAAKASTFYKNASWDLVDAVDQGKADPKKLDKDELPENMREMGTEERIKYIEEMKNKREEIQKEIARLRDEREEYVADKRKEMAENGGDDSLGEAVLKTVREQSRNRGFSFE